MKCLVNSDCSDSRIRSGYCNKHYLRFRKYGDPLAVAPPKYRIDERPNVVPVLVSGHLGYYLVDSKDDFISTTNWYGDKKDTYAYTVKLGKKIYLHRYVTKASKDDITDHKNGDRTDNRLENLRLVDYRTNGINRNVSNSNTGHRNVYKTANGNYQVKVGLDYQNHYLGTYNKLEDAINKSKEFWQRVSAE